MVALEGLLYCEKQKFHKITKYTQSKKKNLITTTTTTTVTGVWLCPKTDKEAESFAPDSCKLRANEFVSEIKKSGCACRVSLESRVS